jgi:hypothetical protein
MCLAARRLSGKGKVEATEAGVSLNVDQDTSETDEVQGEDLFLGAKVSRGYCFRLAKNGQDLAGSF